MKTIPNQQNDIICYVSEFVTESWEMQAAKTSWEYLKYEWTITEVIEEAKISSMMATLLF